MADQPRQSQPQKKNKGLVRRTASRTPGAETPPSGAAAVAEEIERLNALVRELRTENDRLARLAAFPQQAQKTFVELVERAPFGIYVVDSQFRIATMNAGSQNGAFRNVRPIIGRPFNEAMHILWPDAVAEEIIGRFRHTLDTGESYYSPRFVNPRHDVDIVESYEWELHRIVLPDGQHGVICYYFDSTALRDAEQALQKTMNVLAEGQRIAHVGTFEYITSSHATVWSEEEYRIYGLDPAGPSPAYHVMLAEDIHPDDAALLHNTFTAAMKSGSTYELEHRIVRPDGSVRWVYDRAKPFFDEQGNVVRYVGVTQDLTERKQREAALRESEERFRRIAQAGRIGFFEWNASRDTSYWSAEHYEIFGFEAEAAMSWQGWLEGVHAADRDRVVDNAARLLERARMAGQVRGHREEYRFVRSDGSVVWIESDVSAEMVDGEAVVRGAVRDITERKQADQSLRESERRERQRAAELQTILDTAPIGLAIATDPSGLRVQGNRANEEMFGLPPGAELSKVGPRAAGFRPVQDGRELAPVELPMQRAIRGETVEQVFDVVREDGHEIAVYAKATPLFDEAGRPRGAVGAFLDITALKRAEEAVRKANTALAEADRRKDEFIAILSHELRNPLAPIRYALPLLSEERLGEGGRRAVAVIDRQIAHLTRLVDDLLDVSRITAGKIELRPEHVTLSAVLSAAVEAASPSIAAAQHSLDVSVPDAPTWLHVDAARISQAVTNLLNNSAKYTPKGGRIRLEATTTQAQVVIRVADNGVGIAAGELEAVFGMFRQGGSLRKSEGGLGIGLSLSKQFVEMHGGSIEGHSAGEGQGAEFVIRLPLAVPARPEEQQPLISSGKRACLLVLVVDDNVDLVDMLAIVVEADGHQVRKAFDGPSAISAALEYHPHLILLDVGMPDMNGMEVAKELRRHAELAGTRIVALTGWGQAEDRRRTAEAGFDDHFTKPADPRQILRILDDVAQRMVGAAGAD